MYINIIYIIIARSILSVSSFDRNKQQKQKPVYKPLNLPTETRYVHSSILINYVGSLCKQWLVHLSRCFLLEL